MNVEARIKSLSLSLALLSVSILILCFMFDSISGDVYELRNALSKHLLESVPAEPVPHPHNKRKKHD